MPRAKDLTGQRFGKLLVSALNNVGQQGRVWECRCECGGLHFVPTSRLIAGCTKSCGRCRPKQEIKVPRSRKTHGMTGTPIYHRWRSMIRRCHDPKRKDFHNYGGKGVKVCDRWRKFENFITDMGMPDDGQSLDRISQTGDYSPENCRWASAKEQGRNRRTNHLLTFQSRTQPISAWAEEVGISPDVLSYRLKAGWSVEDALTKPLEAHTRKP